MLSAKAMSSALARNKRNEDKFTWIRSFCFVAI